jgi:hypothetical protein
MVLCRYCGRRATRGLGRSHICKYVQMWIWTLTVRVLPAIEMVMADGVHLFRDGGHIGSRKRWHVSTGGRYSQVRDTTLTGGYADYSWPHEGIKLWLHPGNPERWWGASGPVEALVRQHLNLMLCQYPEMQYLTVGTVTKHLGSKCSGRKLDVDAKAEFEG